MNARSPKDITNNFLPVIVAAMCCLKIVREQDMRPMVLLTEDPGYLGPIPLPEITVI